MKTVIKKVIIEGMDFALVREPEWGADHQYGTVPYSEVDEDGCLKRVLNGFEMCVAATPEKAIVDIVRRRVTGA